MLVWEINEGTNVNSNVMTTSGTHASLIFRRKYWYAMAPKRAGTTLANAGCRASLCRTGCKGTSNNTPTARTAIVVREDAAIDNVDMISFSGVPV